MLRCGPDGTALIQHSETCKLRAYMPTPRDRPTIGWGATRWPDGSPVRMGQVWTQRQADANFAASLAAFSAEVWALVGDSPTTQLQFDAMVSLAYNIGTGVERFGGSSVRRFHRSEMYAEAATRFAPWNKQAGVVLGGLVTRRAAEAALYRRGSPG